MASYIRPFARRCAADCNLALLRVLRIVRTLAREDLAGTHVEHPGSWKTWSEPGREARRLSRTAGRMTRPGLTQRKTCRDLRGRDTCHDLCDGRPLQVKTTMPGPQSPSSYRPPMQSEGFSCPSDKTMQHHLIPGQQFLDQLVRQHRPRLCSVPSSRRYLAIQVVAKMLFIEALLLTASLIVIR